jgi:Bacterial extracellular solute-binding protein
LHALQPLLAVEFLVANDGWVASPVKAVSRRRRGEPGVKLVGPLPKELQVALPYSAVLSARPQDEVAAQAFLRALASAEAKQAYVAAGFEVEK